VAKLRVKPLKATVSAIIGVVFLVLAAWQWGTDSVASFVLVLCSFFSFMAIPAFIYPLSKGSVQQHSPSPTLIRKEPKDPLELEKEIGHLNGKFQVVGMINIAIGLFLTVYGLRQPLFFIIGLFDVGLGFYLFL
jgi:hypothetical protein